MMRVMLTLSWLILTAQGLAQDISFRHVVIDDAGPVDPWGKSVGDLNGDQLPDLIVGGSKSGGLVWYQNPNWEKHVLCADKQWSTDHEAVDMDGDGDLDVVALTKTALCWLENPSWQVHAIEQVVLHDIEVADLDADGDVDLVGRDQGEFGHSGATLYFFTRDPTGKWMQRSLACPDGEGLRVADLDGDGDEDVVINKVWLENTGDILGGAWMQHAYAERWMHAATFVACPDINGDGRLDILLSPSELAGGRYRISWFEAPADPRSVPWTEHPIALDVESVHHFVGAADFDSDGDCDVVTAEMEQGADPDQLQLYLNTGDHLTWTPHNISNMGSHSMRVLDMDGDGDSDLFGANWQGQRVDLWINETPVKQATAAAWQYLQIDDARESRSFGIATGDIDADGDLDIAAGDRLYRNPGGRMASAWQRVALPAGVDANLMCDVDGDDRIDILAQRLPEVVWLEATDATATNFESRVVVTGLGATGHGSSQGFAAGDLTNDGKLNYVLTTGDGIYYLSLPEDPLEVPWSAVNITHNAPEEGVAVGDLDNDGWLDVIAWMGSGSGSHQLGWWKNPGRLGGDQSPTWEPHRIGTVTGNEGDRVAVGDFDQDGLLDVVATGTTNAATGSAVYWFANPGMSNPDQTWLRQPIAVDQGALNSLAAADMDGDGIPEVVTAEHRGAKRIIIWHRIVGSDDGWRSDVVDTGKESHLGAHLADLDSDGDLEIISIAWDDFPFLHVWRNDRQ